MQIAGGAVVLSAVAWAQATPIPAAPRQLVPVPEPGGPILPRPLFAVGLPYVNDMAAGDLDRDGDPDVVLGGSDAAGGAVSVLLADGLGGFSAPFVLPAGTGVNATHLVDLDGDLKLDLVLAPYLPVLGMENAALVTIRWPRQGPRRALDEWDREATAFKESRKPFLLYQ